MESSTQLTEARMHERLAVLLARDIVAGRMPEGATFPSGDDLTREHGVSRTVARETLQALAAGGLVHVQHGKRTVVNGMGEWRFLDLLVQLAMQREQLPEKLVRDIYEARLCVEVEVTRLCAGRGSPGTIETLNAVVSATAQLVARADGDAARIAEGLGPLDRAFHGAISDGSGNVVLARMARDAHRGLLTSWPRVDMDRLRKIDEQHRLIALEVERRRPAGAADAMRRHVEWSLEDTLRSRVDGAAAAELTVPV